MSKRTRRHRDDAEGLTLDEHIARKRAALVAERADAPALRAQAAELRATARQLHARWQTRPRLDAERRAAELEEEADVREAMTREHRFETVVVAYLQRYRSETARYKHKEERKASIVDEYLAETDRAPPKVAMTARDVCPRCSGASPLLVCAARSTMSCVTCGYTVTYIDATSSSTAFDDMVEFSQYSYKRVNHYTQWLTLVQGKEAHRVPDDVLEAVMKDLHTRLNVRSTGEITQKRVRDALRHLRLRRAYEHVAQITHRLSGRAPPRLSAHVEDQLRNMFLQMQPAFQRHAPKSRTNFLSYSYVLYRCFQILGLDQMLEGITLLKGRDKLEANDAIFRKMCVDLDWPVFDLPPVSETTG